MSRRNSDNINLFWYGVGANLKKFFVFLSSVIGLTSLLFGYLAESGGAMVVGVILLVVGIWLFISGFSQRFDYQRQSGSIIHGGDW